MTTTLYPPTKSNRTKPPTVYSYVRFSTAEQRNGTGNRRQTDLAAKWCDDRGYTLFKNYSDLGVSAFKGKNASQGELAAFLSCINAGKIEPGSILIVESLDRLSRQTINKAVELFLAIINNGVTVVTLCDGMEYGAGCELPQLVMSLLIFARANDESKMKSQRKAASWRINREAARAEGKPVRGNTPKWIKTKGDKYEVIEAEAEIVRQLFADYIAGSGIYLLNKKYGIPKATIAYWLNNPVVIGTLVVTEDGQKIELPNHYPAIVDMPTWKSAQAKKAQRFIARRQGKTGYVNLFAGLLVDPKGDRFDVSRHYGFSSYVSKNQIILQARPFELVICAEKLADKFVALKYVEDTTNNPEADDIQKKMDRIKKEMLEGDVAGMEAELLPVLRNLKKRHAELLQNRETISAEKLDYDLILNFMTDTATTEDRLQMREIVRDTVKQIKIDNFTSDGWHVLTQGTITLRTGATIKFGFAYCTRRSGYILTDTNDMKVTHGFFKRTKEEPDVVIVDREAEAKRAIKTDVMTDELKAELHKLPKRPAKPEPT